MSEPKSKAVRVERIVPGVLGWHLQDERIDARSDAYAVADGEGTVLIDPLPLADAALEKLGNVPAICLTGSCHQRSAWRYRRRFGAKVHAPRGAEGLEEEPDRWYGDGERLPGGLIAHHAPGPTEVHYAFLRPAGTGTLFCADILYHEGRGKVRFVDPAHQDDPARTRETAERLIELTFRTLCFAHGAPLTKGAREAIRRALRT